jgi:3-oxoacyl-[acyl-carrier-protein] synthase-3
MNCFFPQKSKKTIGRFCKILATASFVPQTLMNNEDIINDRGLPFKSSAIARSIGVENRHIAPDSMTDSDVLYESARKCLDKYSLKPDQLSRLIVNKYFGDNLLPMTASRLLGKLGSQTAVHSFDIDGGVSSFLYSVDTVSRFIGTGDNYVLLSSGGVHVRLISKTDPRVAFLFGDASASLLFGFAPEPHILASYFYTNHQYHDLATGIGIQSIHDLWKESPAAFDPSRLYDTYRMDNWKEAADFYRTATLEISRNLLEESGLGLDCIDLVLVTENNCKIWELTLETLGLGPEKSISLLKNNGNTMSAMLPLLLDYGLQSGRIQPGMNLMLISHGEGASGGGIIYRV